jgi:hypothetical protein
VGRFKDLRIAEFVVHETDLAGRTLAESRLRELTGDELDWKMTAAESATGSMPPGIPVQLIILKGRLQGFGHDYRAALGHLDRFQHDLEKQGYLVTPVSKPLDISPDGSLSDQRDARQESLTFELALTRRTSE